MLTHVPDLHKFLYVVKDNQEKFDVVTSVINSFQEMVIPAYPMLQKGILKHIFLLSSS